MKPRMRGRLMKAGRRSPLDTVIMSAVERNCNFISNTVMSFEIVLIRAGHTYKAHYPNEHHVKTLQFIESAAEIIDLERDGAFWGVHLKHV